MAAYRAKLGENALALDSIGKAERLAPANTEIVFQSVLVHELAGMRGAALRKLD
jgi:cytochrome c-type biogenesis protein CcmH/NrfG